MALWTRKTVAGVAMVWMAMTLAVRAAGDWKGLTAPRGATVCDDRTVCTEGAACCPGPDGRRSMCCAAGEGATCCANGLACCPAGFECDPNGGLCLTRTNLAVPTRPCGGPAQAATGAAGCAADRAACGVAAASGAALCCPPEFICDAERSLCARATRSKATTSSRQPRPWWLPSASFVKPGRTVTCGSGGAFCTKSQTCCSGVDAEGAEVARCCSHENGVCCGGDGAAACCPQGHRCSADGAVCLPEPIPAEPTVSAFEAAVLGLRGLQYDVDSPWQCANGLNCTVDSTCCNYLEGQFGCCLYANAVCCPGVASCCPSGFVCDVSHARCVLVA